MKIVKKKSSENYKFYSREILQYIARTCLRNVLVCRRVIHIAGAKKNLCNHT